MSELVRIWVVNIVLSAIVAGSYVMYAMTFKRVGQAQLGNTRAFLQFGWSVATDPYFIGGLVLALSGTLLRIVLMRWLGIARTALVSEINLLFALIFSWLLFGSKLRFPNDYAGAALIVAGSYLVSRQ